MSIVQTDDRAAARDSGILGGIAIAATAITALGAALLRLRQRRDTRPLSEPPLSAHLRRDIGLPIEPTSHLWREG